MANKIKTLYDQGKALMTPEDNEAEALAEKNANIDEYKTAASVKPTLTFMAAPPTSPSDLMNRGQYGAQPGEQRIDTSAYTKPLGTGELSFHAEGGELDKNKINIVGEDGPEEIIGDKVIPLDHTLPGGRSTAPEEEQEGAPADFSGPVFPNPQHMKSKWDTEKPEIEQSAPMNMDNAKPEDQSAGKPALMQEASNKPSPIIPRPVTSPRKEDAEAYVQGLPGTASPEDRKAAIVAPNDGMMKSKVLQGMDAKSAAARQAQLGEETPAPPDPNQVIADQHAKVMKAKLDAASKGDMVGLGSAIIAGQTLNSASPQATAAAEGGQAPTAAEANLAPGTAMPDYAGKERIGAGTPGEAQAQKDYKDKLADLDQQILTASRIHTPEGKEELGYLQSEKAVLQKMNPLGSAANKPGVLGKIEHALGTVGNVAGNAVLGERNMANIPGSAANLTAQNEEGAANVEQGTKDALQNAQADKAAQPPAVKPQDQLAQNKLDAQNRLGEIAKELQHPGSPEQRQALQQEQQAIYASNPEFAPKPEDQAKQPIGDQGAAQHSQQLDAIAQAAGFTPEQAQAQQQAYGAQPGDTAATASKKLDQARAVAQLDASRRDRQTAQDAAANLRADTKAEKQEAADTKRTDDSFKYNQSRLEKLRKPVDDIAMRMGRLKQTVNENTPLADALVAPELLTAMAGGQGSGLRMNEAEISRIVGGRGHWADLQAAVNKWKLDPKAALSITPEQRREIHSLLDVASKRVERSASIVDDANAKMSQAKSPEEHRHILAETESKLSRSEIGKVKVQIPGHPEAEISLDKLDQFKKDHPDATVE